MSNATISRTEAGERVPSRPEINAWSKATGASRAARDRLLQLAEAAYNEVQTWRDSFASAGHLQGRAADMDASALRIRKFDPTIVTGLLQTAEYARRIFELCNIPGHDITTAVKARMDRQQVLYEGDRNFDFLICESALRFRVGPPRVLRAQLDRIISLNTLDTVSIGVIPATHKPTAIGWHAFSLHEDVIEGDPYVYIELGHAQMTVTEPRDVDTYRTAYGELSKAALFDQDAAEFIHTLTRELSR